MNQKGFTLIEMIIVIFIFGVGILGVLNVLTHSLGYFDEITMKTNATFLAKEGIEIAYNFRDSNLERGYPWNYIGYNEEQEQYLGEKGNKTFKVGFTENGYWQFQPEEKKSDFDTNFKNFYLELFTGNQEKQYVTYEHPENKIAETEKEPHKGFARILEFSEIKDGANNLDTNKILKLTSRVLYKRGSSTGEVILQGFIGTKDSIPAEKNIETN